VPGEPQRPFTSPTANRLFGELAAGTNQRRQDSLLG
jgi:hypothetical protein